MEINQQSFLNLVDIALIDDKPVFFSLGYITTQGEYRNYSKCSKKHFEKKEMLAEKVKSSGKKNNYSLKNKGILRVYDHESATHRSLLIDLIVSYNGNKII